MEGTQVALVPVEDKDGDNLWVDAPNVQSSAIFASSPVTDIMYAESQFTPLYEMRPMVTRTATAAAVLTPPPGNAPPVYALTGAEVDAWSGGSDSVGGNFILRMEGTQVALVPVEDKDGDNLWVDAPNAQSSAIFASSPVTDIMYAESQFTPLANASYGDTDGDGGSGTSTPPPGNAHPVYANGCRG